jgi:hypothetical protein
LPLNLICPVIKSGLLEVMYNNPVAGYAENM